MPFSNTSYNVGSLILTVSPVHYGIMSEASCCDSVQKTSSRSHQASYFEIILLVILPFLATVFTKLFFRNHFYV